jgi:hypothetical protein
MTITIIIILPLKSNLWFFFDIKNICFSNLITIIIILLRIRIILIIIIIIIITIIITIIILIIFKFTLQET